MGRWFDPRDGQVKWAPDPPAQPAPRPAQPPVTLAAPKNEESSTLINGRPMWVSRDGVTHWNPDLVADHSRTIGLHEAAHAVASYLLGRRAHSVEAGERKGLTLVPQTDDTFASVVCLLAGEAFERSIGLPPSGTMKDIEKATKLLERKGLSGQVLDEACRILEETAIELVASERFQSLVFALGSAIAKQRYVGEHQIRQILVAADSRRVGTERHSAPSSPPINPWYIVELDHQELYRGSSHEEAKRVQAQHARSRLVGSIYG